MSSIGHGEERAATAAVSAASRKRAAIETYSRHEDALRRTARRYSLCADDADEALQRALEILLLKAPSDDQRELIRWTQTVVKHEALAVKRDRERILSGPAAVTPEPGRDDWVAMIPARTDGPPERAERQEAIARSREALQTLKPQELRALGLLAEGYSYKEIGEITGFSHTKINRCLAEGREKFRRVLSRSRDGSRCEEMRPLLSAFCDSETSDEETAVLREHLRACANCRGTLRAYRAAPAAAAALAPALPLSRSLLDRAHDAFAGFCRSLRWRRWRRRLGAAAGRSLGRHPWRRGRGAGEGRRNLRRHRRQRGCLRRHRDRAGSPGHRPPAQEGDGAGAHGRTGRRDRVERRERGRVRNGAGTRRARPGAIATPPRAGAGD